MNLKRAIKQIPFAVKLHKKCTAFVDNAQRKSNLKQLEKRLKNTRLSEGLQIAEALKSLRRNLPQADQAWIEKIENERKRLLCRTELLNDGTLDGGGLYDEGVTIQRACSVSKPRVPATLLFMLTRSMKPAQVIELGTNVGISSAYIAAALELNGQGGKIVTLDASSYRQRLAKEVHRNIGIDNVSYIQGLFAETLNPSLIELGSLDLAFIDGHHQYQPTLDYFEEILKFSTPDGVFVFDDIRWSDGMKKAWSQIQSDDRLGLVIDLKSVGVCARGKQEVPQRFVFDPIDPFPK